ncbi:MAG: hypothetical protein KDA24_29925 [Deltaproteobacteria bacterium]|nr:hypothetical protein [Deltaproteobacteria bacterium]
MRSVLAPTLRLALCAVALLLLGAMPGRYSARAIPAGEVPSIGSLQFLAGSWETDPGKAKGAAITEEFWSPPRGGTMLGSNRVTKDDRTVFWEQLRVEEREGDGLYYVANPMGKGEVAFRLTKVGANFASFENPEHDWPQTINYGLTDIEGQLHAEVSGTLKGEPRTETWTFLRRTP